MNIYSVKTMPELVTKIAAHKKIYIYGAGEPAVKIVEGLIKIGFKVQAVLLSNDSNNLGDVCNVPVQRIEKIAFDDEDIIILGLTEKYKDEIIEIVRSNGFRNIVEIVNIGIFDNRIEKEALKYYPKLEITVQMGCRIGCHYCPQKLLLTKYFEGFSQRVNILSLAVFKKCIDKLPKECVVTFSGFCEPFQHPEIVEMIKYADEKGFAIELYTTFDGCTIEQFEAIRGINFSRVVLHEPDEEGHAHINCNEEYWRVIDCVLDWKRSDGSMMCAKATGQAAPSREFIEKSNGRIKINTVLHNRAGNLENDDKLKTKYIPNGKIYCIKSLYQNQWVLLPDGTVTLCCNDFGLRHVIGNLLESSYDELLQSDEYKRVKRQMIDLEDSKGLLCRECFSANKL